MGARRAIVSKIGVLLLALAWTDRLQAAPMTGAPELWPPASAPHDPRPEMDPTHPWDSFHQVVEYWSSFSPEPISSNSKDFSELYDLPAAHSRQSGASASVDFWNREPANLDALNDEAASNTEVESRLVIKQAEDAFRVAAGPKIAKQHRHVLITGKPSRKAWTPITDGYIPSHGARGSEHHYIVRTDPTRKSLVGLTAEARQPPWVGHARYVVTSGIPNVAPRGELVADPAPRARAPVIESNPCETGAKRDRVLSPDVSGQQLERRASHQGHIALTRAKRPIVEVESPTASDNRDPSWAPYSAKRLRRGASL